MFLGSTEVLRLSRKLEEEEDEAGKPFVPSTELRRYSRRPQHDDDDYDERGKDLTGSCADQTGADKRGWRYDRGSVVRTKEEQAARRREAQQRWKILCLVRTFHGADGVDELTRRERLASRVDDWMAGFVNRLRISKDGGVRNGATAHQQQQQQQQQGDRDRKSKDSGLESGDPDTTTSSLLLHHQQQQHSGGYNSSTSLSVRERRAWERRRFEDDQRQRIQQRAQRERERTKTNRLRRRLERSPVNLLRDEEEPRLLLASSPEVRSGLLRVATGEEEKEATRKRRTGRSVSPSTKEKGKRGQRRGTAAAKRGLSSSPRRSKETTAKRTAKISIRIRAARRKKHEEAEAEAEEERSAADDVGEAAAEEEEEEKRKRTRKRKKGKKRKRGRKRSRSRGESDRGLPSSSSPELLAGGGDGDLHSMVEDATETVVARLVYDERLGDFVERGEEEGASDDDVGEEELPREGEDGEGGREAEWRRRRDLKNPVYSAFDQAKGVDDLYRIAEIWVNPANYGLSTS